MPNWKKVIVSGSDAILTSVTATGGLIVTGSARITGSLGVTGSLSNGLGIIASGNYSHAEGESTTASGSSSHAEGYNTKAYGGASHAEGGSTTATGSYSHAEGGNTKAYGDASHAEGYNTTSSAAYSHAEGSNTTTTGDSSHAEGYYTVAQGNYQHVQGAYNLSSSAQSAFIVGNGTGTGALRSNLIFASGSTLQVTGSVIATAGFTGSLQGTASYATMASQSGYTMQFVLSTTGSNPDKNTKYIMGAPMQNRLLLTAGATRIYVPRPGRVSYANCWIKQGTVGSPTNSQTSSSFHLNKITAAGAIVSESIGTFISSTILSASIVSTAISMSVVQGDALQITYTTPYWTLTPRAVEASAIIYIENNI